MWPHFVHLVFRILHGMPSLVSSNWAAWLLGIGAFCFSQGILFFRPGWRENWRPRLGRWKNLKIGLLSTAVVYVILLMWSTFQTIYDDHQDSVGRWQSVVKEKENLKSEIGKRDVYIKRLEAKSCPLCPAKRGPDLFPESQPRALSELQIAILRRDLKAGAGLKMRINVIGTKPDTRAFADELARVFDGWQVEKNIIGSATMAASSELEFAIPQPQDPAVQIAVAAFDRAHINYTKNVGLNSYRGPISAGSPPALTINVTDR